jgi:hypothetical protein
LISINAPIVQKRNSRIMRRLFQIIGAVSIVALSFAAVTDSLAQSIGSLPAKQLCWHALNPDTLSAWDQSPNYSGYVAEAERRGLTVDACRQVIGAADGGASNPPARTEGTSDPPASTESGSGRRSSPVKAETSFIEAATFFLTGVDATGDEIVSEREIVLRKYPFVIYLVNDKSCVVRMRNVTSHEIWQMNFCMLTGYLWGGDTLNVIGKPDAFCGSTWLPNENFMDSDFTKTGKPVTCNFLGVQPDGAYATAFQGGWDAYMLTNRKFSIPFRSQQRLMASLKYINKFLTGKPY